MSTEITTTDLNKFGQRELKMLELLLREWRLKGLPKDFDIDEVRGMFNMHSGEVFLTNSNFQVAMKNGDKLESFYSCPHCGEEGFFEDIEDHGEGGECAEWMSEVRAGREVV